MGALAKRQVGRRVRKIDRECIVAAAKIRCRDDQRALRQIQPSRRINGVIVRPHTGSHLRAGQQAPMFKSIDRRANVASRLALGETLADKCCLNQRHSPDIATVGDILDLRLNIGGCVFHGAVLRRHGCRCDNGQQRPQKKTAHSHFRLSNTPGIFSMAAGRHSPLLKAGSGPCARIAT